MKRHEQREIALNSLYQHLLLNKDIRKYEAMHGTNEIDGYLYSITVDTVAHEYNYIQTINHILRKDWTFNRLSVLEQAILLMACQEILVNQTPKAVVIDEAVGLAKKYCDDDSYKLINGVLDRL